MKIIAQILININVILNMKFDFKCLPKQLNEV